MNRLLLSAAAILCFSLATSQAIVAQPSDDWGPRGGWGRGMMMGPGMMMGSGRMSWRGPGLCQRGNMGEVADWRVDRIERIVRPTDAQKPALAELRNTMKTAAEKAAENCPREFPATLPARIELMEKRLEAMLAAMKSVRPAFQSFYDKLDADQKTRLDTASPGRWGWRGGWR